MSAIGLLVAPLMSVEHRQVVEAHGDVGMIRPKRLLPDRQGTLQQRLGCGVCCSGGEVYADLVEQNAGRLWLDIQYFGVFGRHEPV